MWPTSDTATGRSSTPPCSSPHQILSSNKRLIVPSPRVLRLTSTIASVTESSQPPAFSCALAGDRDGYFGDFTGTAADIAATIRQGWFYTGQYAPYFGAPRGSDPAPVRPSQIVVSLQTHDQVGNRAFGDRLHHKIGAEAYRMAAALLLFLPETPLLFMGQEWAASTPFLFFR